MTTCKTCHDDLTAVFLGAMISAERGDIAEDGLPAFFGRMADAYTHKLASVAWSQACIAYDRMHGVAFGAEEEEGSVQ